MHQVLPDNIDRWTRGGTLMDFALTEDQQIMRDQIIRFARSELNAGVQERDASHEFPRELWSKCGEMGLQGLPVPKELGGIGLDSLSTAMAIEAFGYGCRDGGLVFSICAHLLACVVPVWKNGSEAQKSTILPKLCNGSLIAVNAMTEPGTGSDAFAMSSQAVKDGDGYRLNGTKIFSSNAPVADLALFYALTDPEKGYHGGISAFLVEKGTEGFSVGQTFKKMGLHTSPIGELIFNNVYVPEENLLGQLGGGAVMFSQSMEWERICLVAAHIGTMQRLMEAAIDHAKTRKQFGQTIGKLQAVSHRIVDMKVRLEAARMLCYRGAWNLERTRAISVEASLVKLFVSESLVQTALDTVRTFGGYGFMAEYDVERSLRDSVGSILYSGTSDMQREIIARWLGL
jgi:alkylation response protein AidB-like acyl-CoA dehydrogenase